MEKRVKILFVIGLTMVASIIFAAYHHQGERDSANFLKVHPAKAGGKLDQCDLCHSGGQIEKNGTKVTMGSCQWCHYKYGYDKKGSLAETMNPYGRDYMKYGRSDTAVTAISNLDSDKDGFSNNEEIIADRFPGNANDDPKKMSAVFRVYTRAQLEAFPQCKEFLLMNASKSSDGYAEYSGVSMETLLRDAGILASATGITVFAPDGWSQYHPLRPLADPAMYHVFGTYPEAEYNFSSRASFWCDYSAPSCAGRKPGETIKVQGGLRMLLANKREGRPLIPAVLAKNNKLDGEGPYRVIVPQKVPSPPDQSSKAENQDVLWPYKADWDHNAGSSTRAVTMIRVEPLPPGMTDIDITEIGWRYIDEAKIVIYGAIRAEKETAGDPKKPLACIKDCAKECGK
jgi:hypothetical protein